MDQSITIYGRELAEDEHLAAALKAGMRQQNCVAIEIFIEPRKSDGWLEYGVRCVYQDGGKLFIGVIQREPGGPIEYHS